MGTDSLGRLPNDARSTPHACRRCRVDSRLLSLVHGRKSVWAWRRGGQKSCRRCAAAKRRGSMRCDPKLGNELAASRMSFQHSKLLLAVRHHEIRSKSNDGHPTPRPDGIGLVPRTGAPRVNLVGVPQPALEQRQQCLIGDARFPGGGDQISDFDLNVFIRRTSRVRRCVGHHGPQSSPALNQTRGLELLVRSSHGPGGNTKVGG